LCNHRSDPLQLRACLLVYTRQLQKIRKRIDRAERLADVMNQFLDESRVNTCNRILTGPNFVRSKRDFLLRNSELGSGLVHCHARRFQTTTRENWNFYFRPSDCAP